MIRPQRIDSTCAVCGETCQFSVPEAVTSVGSRDLDTRPPEPLRSTIYAWVRRCPTCGYCAPNLSKAPDGATDVVGLPLYREQLDSQRFPEVANNLLCWSIIQENLGKPAQAAWTALHAAWACDDEECDVPARVCRKHAADLLKQAWKESERLTPIEGADEALLVDILRRSGRFREARTIAKETLEQNLPDPLIAAIMRFQIRLITSLDRGTHKISEVQIPSKTISLR